MEDDPKIIQLEIFNNNVEPAIITRENIYKKEIAELQKNLYSAYDRIKDLNSELHRIRSQLNNK
jgi:hypothetical protein